jgi:uncharacterized membrane protein
VVRSGINGFNKWLSGFTFDRLRGQQMEYINTANIITAAVVLLMLYFIKNLFTAVNRFFYILALIALGVGLYLWRSGVISKLIDDISGVV